MSHAYSAEEAIVIATAMRASWSYTFAMEVFMKFSANEPGNYSLSLLPRETSGRARGLEAGPASRAIIPGRTMSTLFRESRAGARDVVLKFAPPGIPICPVFSFALLAVPLGARPRRGGRAPVF